MAYRFAAFELDEQARELRLEGREIAIQPRVFDLLLHLVRNKNRVVGKDELLDALWPDVVVTESSLQRAVSLARSALRQGGLSDAIRTFSKQGYRFCHALIDEHAAEAGGEDATSLHVARAAFDAGGWSEAVDAFKETAARAGGLAGEDLERWGYAAFCTGEIADAVTPLQSAVAAFAAGGNNLCAARAALLLSHVHFELADFAVSKGWLARARTLLGPADDCRETGLLDALQARFEFADGDMETAVQHTEDVVALGRRIGEPDVEVLGLSYNGMARLSLGETTQATGRLDEAAALVLEGRVHPLICGTVYCGVIWGYRNLADWQRAGEWIEHFTRWCSACGLATYSGSCSLHRAEVLASRGHVEEAEIAIAEACARLPENCPRVEGESYRILGDLHLVRGDLDAAEAAFRKAHELGFDPQPGFAMLQIARGQPEAALRGLERALQDPGWSPKQRRGQLLTHLAIAAVAASRPKLARQALEEFDAMDERDIPALGALRARAWAELCASSGESGECFSSLRQAIQAWREIGSPLNVAWAQLRLAELFLEDGDPAAAELELDAAESAFRSAGAPRICRRCEELRQKLAG